MFDTAKKEPRFKHVMIYIKDEEFEEVVSLKKSDRSIIESVLPQKWQADYYENPEQFNSEHIEIVELESPLKKKLFMFTPKSLHGYPCQEIIICDFTERLARHQAFMRNEIFENSDCDVIGQALNVDIGIVMESK